MLLPQMQGGLERYFNELPEKIEILTEFEHYGIYDFKNQALEWRYRFLSRVIFGEKKVVHKLVFNFWNFLPEEVYLKLMAHYNPKERRAEVRFLALDNEDRRLAIVAKNMNCLKEEIQPYHIISASDFLNKVLEKYNFHSIYDEFERKRKHQNEQILLK